MKVVTKERLDVHPLEDVFDIDPGTTITEFKEVVPSEIVEMPNYDAKDDEIEQKLEEIYSVAMGNVSTMGDEVERVEGKYKARIGEVTATMLNVALGAVNAKSALKMHKDKTRTAPTQAAPHTVNNNLIVADRNELLRAMLEKKNQ